MTERATEETRPDSDLRDHLHQMEAKVRKLRDARNNHNEQGKRFAEQRNAIQSQYKEHREKVELAVALEGVKRPTLIKMETGFSVLDRSRDTAQSGK